jgi:hypothetical protein
MVESGYIVTYNGQAPWGSGTGLGTSTPFVSLEVEEVWQAGRLGYVRTVTLNGTIPSGGTSQITGLRDCFAANFKPFIAPNITMSGAQVQEISFGSQNYIGKVDYTVTLRDYSGFTLGVTEPVDEVSFQDQQDGSVIINHRISALGISTSGDANAAFNSAKSFVLGRTGTSTINSLTTSFINAANKAHVYAVSQQESINRLAGTYSVTEVFRYDPLRDVVSNTCRRFSVELNSGINDDYMQTTVNGIYQVGKDAYDSGLFAQVSQSELYNVASTMVVGLNPAPLSFNVESESASQNLYTRTLNVRAVFDNSPIGSFFDYDFEAAKDYHNGVTQLNIRGAIMGSGRHVRRKFQSAKAFFDLVMGGSDGAKSYIYNAAISGASALGYTAYSFNPQPKALSIAFNSGQGVITINASFDDGPFVSGYSEFGWQASSDCGLNVFKPHPSANLNGSYVIQDLGIINRTSVSIVGNFAFPATGTFSKIDHAGIRTKLINLEGAVNAFGEAEGYTLSSGEAIKSGFNSTYTRDGCALSTLPVDGKIYAGTRI